MFYIGIVLCKKHVTVGVVDSEYNVVSKAEKCACSCACACDVVASVAELCKDAVAKAGISFDDVAYAGVAADGIVNNADGVIEYSETLPFTSCAIADELKKALPLKAVYADSIINAVTWAEFKKGVGKGSADFVYISLGEQIESGIIIDGEIYTGFNYAGAELGHIVIEFDGRQCKCGRKGCFNAYASVEGLRAIADGKSEDVHEILTTMPEAAARFNGYFGCGITDTVNLFQPNVLALGGKLSEEGDLIMKPLMEIVNREQYSRHSDEKTQIKFAEIKENAALIGAALLKN